MKQQTWAICAVIISMLISACNASQTTASPVPVVGAVITPDFQRASGNEIPDRIGARLKLLAGTLALVLETDTNCYHPTDVIPLRLYFHNLTNQRIKLLTQFIITPNSRSQDMRFTIFPELSSPNGQLLEFGIPVDIVVENPSAKEFVDVDANGNLSFNLRFSLSTVQLNKSSGQFQLRIRYKNEMFIGPAVDADISHQYDWGTWVGEVESNLIGICIQNP